MLGVPIISGIRAPLTCLWPVCTLARYGAFDCVCILIAGHAVRRLAQCVEHDRAPASAQGPQRTRPNAGPKSIRNQVGIEMVSIQAGSFTMGSTDAEVQAAYEDAKRVFPQNAKLDWFTGEMPRLRQL